MVKSLVNRYRKHQTGLTLIEVLIALAIAAIAITAVIKAASQSIRGTSYLQDKTIAMWVGQEVLTEARLKLIALPSISQPMQRNITMLDRDWYITAGQSATDNKRIRKLIVKVYARQPESDEVSSLVTLEGYVYLP